MKFVQKNWLPLALGLAIILAIILNTHGTKTEIQSPKEEAGEITLNTQSQCFLYESLISSEIISQDTENAYNREYIEIAISDNGLATGQHLILPYGTDSNRADFLGVAMDGFINVVATANAEGETWQEQRVYKIVDNKLYVGYQEVFVPRYKNENNIYLYEDINKLTFETDEFFLNKVDCDSIDRSVL